MLTALDGYGLVYALAFLKDLSLRTKNLPDTLIIRAVSAFLAELDAAIAVLAARKDLDLVNALAALEDLALGAAYLTEASTILAPSITVLADLVDPVAVLTALDGFGLEDALAFLEDLSFSKENLPDTLTIKAVSALLADLVVAAGLAARHRGGRRAGRWGGLRGGRRSKISGSSLVPVSRASILSFVLICVVDSLYRLNSICGGCRSDKNDRQEGTEESVVENHS